MNLFKSTLIAAAVLVALPLAAHAESKFVTGNGKLSAQANLDFQVKIPQILMLQIGAADSVSLVTFDVSGNAVGTGAVAGSSDQAGAGGKVTAKLLANVGDVRLAAATTGALSNGAGGTISYSKITATSSNGFVSPAFTDGASNTVTIAAGSNKVINQSADWTFSYANDAVIAPGTYGGVNTGGGRVTYTASMP